MTRFRCLIVCVVLVLVSADLAVFTPDVQAAGSVAVTAWSCDSGLDPKSTDPAVFAATCPTEADGLTFALTAGGITRRRATAPGRPASWPAVTGDFTLALEEPKGEPAVVFCTRNDGTPERFEAPAGEITGDLAADTALSCQWYRLPAASPQPTPTPQPTATPTVKPTTAPTATATTAPNPSATPFPTSTPFPTATVQSTEAATPTPTPTVLPEPIDTGPPEMYRGDPAHTGHQNDAGPDGDPVLLWRYPIGTTLMSSPAIAAGTVYVGGDTGLYAIDAATGNERWHYETELPFTASPAVVNGVVYAGGLDGEFVAVDAGTGVVRWRFPTEGKIRSSAVVDDDVVYFTSYDGNAYALDAETGEERWRFATGADDLASAPALADGVVYVAGGGVDGGMIYALDATDGRRLWRYGVSGIIGSSPTVLGGAVYFGSDDGVLYAVNVETGKGQCRFQTPKPVRSSPAALDGVIVVGNRGANLFALNSATCDEIWSVKLGDWLDSPPVVAGSTLYIGSKDDSLYAVNSGNGEVRWSFPTEGSITTQPVVAGGVVYVTSRDGYLYAVTGSENEIAPPPEAELPDELVLDGERYRFDRSVPLDSNDLEALGAVGPIVVYGRADQQETDPVYADGGDNEEGELARYLPERIGAARLACPAERQTVAGQIASGQVIYAFAGAETDLTPDQLTKVLDTSDIGAIYTDGDQSPPQELFAETPDGLQRFVLLDADGLPPVLQGEFSFGGQTFAFAEEVTDDVDANDLDRVGCAGPFALEAEPDAAEAPFTRLYATIADKLLAFDAVES